MQAAVISDVHGNVVALEAVLADAQAVGVEAYWCLGDLAAHGPHPAEAVARVRALPGLRCVRGNTDRYAVTGDLSGILPPIGDPVVLTEAHASFAWTRDRLADGGHVGWVASLSTEERFTLCDGTRVLLVHASPGRDDGPGLDPRRDAAALSATDLVLVGHTHEPADQVIGDCRAVNPGLVSLPRPPDGLARWALVEATPGGVTVEHRTSAYDLDAVIDDLVTAGHPSATWLAAKLAPRPT